MAGPASAGRGPGVVAAASLMGMNQWDASGNRKRKIKNVLEETTESCDCSRTHKLSIIYQN